MTVEEVSVSKKKCFLAPSRCELIVWAYIKLFISNLLLVGLCYTWAHICNGPASITTMIVSTGITTVAGVINFILSGVFIFGCNKKNIRALKKFYFFSQFFMSLVAAASIYVLAGIIVFLTNNVYWMPLELWIYQAMNMIILTTAFVVEIRIFLMVGKVLRKKSFRQPIYATRNPEEECLLKIEDSCDEDVENPEEHMRDEKEKLNEAVLGG